MTRVLKLLALIPALLFLLAIVYVGWLYLFSEKYDAIFSSLRHRANMQSEYLSHCFEATFLNDNYLFSFRLRFFS